MLMREFRMDADHLQLAAMTCEQIKEFAFRRTAPAHLEPSVPFQALPWTQYTAPGPFDLICLARSPEYTPAACDTLFDVLRERFIDEDALARWAPRRSERQSSRSAADDDPSR